MRILSLLTTFALTRSSTALPPLLLTSNTSSLDALTINTTTLFRQPWPQVPWIYVLDETTSIAIEHYGRNVCSGNWHCEERVLDGMNQIVEIVREEYVMEHEKINSFTSGGVSFWIRQETTLLKIMAMELVSTLRWMMLRHGTREVTHGGIVDHGTLAVTFELTFPGMED